MHGASLCVLSESLNYLTKSFKAITDLTVLQYYLLFYSHFHAPFKHSLVLLCVPGWEGSQQSWDCHCCSVSVFIRLQEHDSLYASLRLQPQHRVGGGCVCFLPALSFTHTWKYTYAVCLYFWLAQSLLSPVLLISGLVGWELCHSLGARLCHPENLHALIPAHFVQWSCSLTFEWNFTYIQKGVN